MQGGGESNARIMLEGLGKKKNWKQGIAAVILAVGE